MAAAISPQCEHRVRKNALKLRVHAQNDGFDLLFGDRIVLRHRASCPAVVMARGNSITCADLPAEVQVGRAVEAGPTTHATLPEQVEALERRAIEQAMVEAGGVQSRAAELLGITERNLRYKLKKYGFK